jgi:predicted phosphodiesterase
MAKPSLKLEKAVEIVNKFESTGNAPLAALLYKQNSALYKDAEEARWFVRSARGSGGHGSLKTLKAEKQIKFESGKVHNPYALPDELHYNCEPYHLAVNKNMVLGILSDIHFPYQSNEALTIALDKCKKDKVTHLLLNGDLIDCHEISTFDKDPNKRHFYEEIKVVNSFFETLKKKFPGVKIIFKEGNHEERFLRYMRRKAPELLGFEIMNFPHLLKLKEKGIDFVASKRIIRAGKLNIIHGHEFGQQIFSPVNPARGFFLKAKTNVIGGHHHQASSHSANDLTRHSLIAVSTGCLCELNPEYRPINEWSHGFAIVRFKENKWFNINNYKIIEGQVVNA